jgi:parallel beta helix pectate lyase-like protein
VSSEATASRAIGFWIGAGSVVAMTDAASDGAQFGVAATDEGTQATLRGATLSNNTEAGLVTGGAGLARIGDSTVTGNGDGLRNVDGTLESFGDNLVRGNTTDVSGTITTVSTSRPAQSAPVQGAETLQAPGARTPAVDPQGAPAAPAEATATIQRTFVSTSGSDANNCTATAPCRGFAAAIANTTAGGEVVALDSGGYGAFAVNKAITIAGAPGAHVAVTVFSGTGIEVNAAPSDAVVLRNLYVTGLGGIIGIWYRGGGHLYVEGVTSSGFTFPGGLYANAANGTLVVRDSVFRDNVDPVEGFGSGIFVNASMRVEIADSRADGNDVGFNFNSAGRGAVVRSSATGNFLEGFAASNGAVVAVTDTVIDGNAFTGVEAFNDGSRATFRGATLSNNGFRGIWSHFGSPLVRIAGSTVTGHDVGLVQADAGTIETFQDNLVRGNGAPSSGTITPVAKS